MTWRHLAVAVYRRLLAVYPEPRRTGDRAAMAETFELRMREAARQGLARGIAFAIREYAGLIHAGASARWQRPTDRRNRLPSNPPRVSGGTAYVTELRFALRRLVRSPMFTITAVVTLGLGIGANTAVFSVVNGILLSALPYPQPDQLVWLDHGGLGINAPRGLGMTSGLYHYYRAQSETLAGVAIWEEAEWTLSDDRGPQRVRGIRATESLADVLGVRPALGRWLSEQDRLGRGSAVAVISDALWRQRFGRSPTTIGSSIRIEGVSVEVIGVMPPGFGFPTRDIDLWIPYVIRGPERFGGFTPSGIGRLVPDASLDDLQRELDRLIGAMPGAIPDPSATAVVEDAQLIATPIPFKDHVVGNVRPTLWLLMGTMIVLLSIACANTANLLLVRAELTRRERAIRRALGAEGRALRRPALADSTLLAAAGALIGMAVAVTAVEVAVAMAPATIPRLDNVRVDATSVAFTGALAILAVLVFTILPELTGSQHVTDALRASSRTPSAAPRAMRTRQWIATGQIALALVLLVGAGLLIRTLWNLRQVDPGFTADNTLTFAIDLPQADYPAREAAVQFNLALLDRLEALPGVTGAAAVGRCLPLAGWCGGDPLRVRGRLPVPGEVPPIVALRTATARYFEVMGIPLRAGRVFTEAEERQGADVVVVSETLARRYFGEASPLGQAVHDGLGGGEEWYTIVGVVGDVPARGLTDEGAPMIYFPLRSTDERGADPHALYYVLGTTVPPSTVAGAVRAAVRDLDARVPVLQVTTLSAYVSDQTRGTAFTTWLLAVAAGLALLLGVVGVFGVNSYLAATRRGEFGLRLALGAQASDVGRLVVRQAGAMVAGGLCIGLIAAGIASRIMTSLLFGVKPVDPVTYLTVSAALAATTFIAVAIPAVRAARIDPIDALRE